MWEDTSGAGMIFPPESGLFCISAPTRRAEDGRFHAACVFPAPAAEQQLGVSQKSGELRR